MTELLQHGDLETVKTTVPLLDHVACFGDVRFQVVREAPFEVHFQAERNCLTVPLIHQTCEWAPDSDEISVSGSHFGQATFHPEGSQTYCRTIKRSGDLIVIDFPSHFCIADDETPSVNDSLMETRVLTDSDFGSIGNMVRSAALNPQSTDQLFADSVVNLALSVARRASGANPKPCSASLGSDIIGVLIDYIEAHIDTNINIDQLASLAGLSCYYFSRSFKAATGLSPHQFVLERRLIRAREMLEDTHWSLAEIAYAVGFSSQAHMTYTFRKRLGVTPGLYRNSCIN